MICYFGTNGCKISLNISSINTTLILGKKNKNERHNKVNVENGHSLGKGSYKKITSYLVLATYLGLLNCRTYLPMRYANNGFTTMAS